MIPPNYWDNSYKNNILQKLWYDIKFKALRKININKGSNILDIGCGSGFSIEKIIPQDVDVYGIDPEKEIIEYAKKIRPRYNFQMGYAEDLPYENSYFDAVYFLDVIEHLRDPVLSLKEARRVLKINGTLIILVVRENHPVFKLIWKVWKKTKGKIWNDAHLWIFNKNNLSDALTKAGFNSFKIYKIHFGMSLLVVAKNI